MMHMTFYWGRRVTLLFDGWETTTWLSYALSLLSIFLFAAFHQYVENLRDRLQKSPAGKSPVEAPLLSRISVSTIGPQKLAVAALFGVSSAVAYFLMLAVMSFNAGIFIAAVAGLAVGFFVFREEVIVAAVENHCACS